MNTVTLYPANKKVKVRKPDGSHLDENGESVALNAFWHRRLRDGSVIDKKPAAKSAAKTKGATE